MNAPLRVAFGLNAPLGVAFKLNASLKLVYLGLRMCRSSLFVGKIAKKRIKKIDLDSFDLDYNLITKEERTNLILSFV